MRITLNQEEIEEAIEKLILDQVDVPDDMRIDIDLKATRGDEGYTAEVDILPFDAPDDGTDRSVDPRINVVGGAEGMSIADKAEEARRNAAKPRRRGRPAGARNKPKTHRVEPDLEVSHETKTEAEVEQEADVESTPQEAESEPDTSDIPETGEEFFEEAQLSIPQEEPAPEPEPEPKAEPGPPAEPKPTRSLFANLASRS